MMEDLKKLSKEELKRRIAAQPPLNIGIFVTGGKDDQHEEAKGQR